MIVKHSKNYNARALALLWGIFSAIMIFSIAVGQGPAVLTGVTRPKKKGKLSFHPEGKAIDIRCNDKPQWWIDGVIHIIMAFKCFDERVGYLVHGKGRNRHIHIQVKIGDPV